MSCLHDRWMQVQQGICREPTSLLSSHQLAQKSRASPRLPTVPLVPDPVSQTPANARQLVQCHHPLPRRAEGQAAGLRRSAHTSPRTVHEDAACDVSQKMMSGMVYICKQMCTLSRLASMQM